MSRPRKEMLVRGVLMRICARCESYKVSSNENFYRVPSRGSWSSYCRPCQREVKREYDKRKKLEMAQRYAAYDGDTPILPH